MGVALLALWIGMLVIYVLWFRTERRFKLLAEKVADLEHTLGQTASLLQSFARLEKLIEQMMGVLSSAPLEPMVSSAEMQIKHKDDTLTSEKASWSNVDDPTKPHQTAKEHALSDQLEGWQKEVLLRWQRGETASTIARALGRGTGEVTLLIEMIQRRT